MARVNLQNLKNGAAKKKAEKVEIKLDAPEIPNFVEQEDEFGDIIALPDDKAETERVSRYFLDDTDIEGKSFVGRGEKIIFTLVSLMARNPKFKRFDLHDFPKLWLHYALGENQGQGRSGVLSTLRGKVDIGPQKEAPLPGEIGR